MHPDLAELDARELRAHAALAQAQAELRAVAAERSRLLAELIPLVPERRPLQLLGAQQLLERWQQEAPGAPATAEALLHRMRRAAGDQHDRWRALWEVGDRHRAGRTLRWPWPEAERAIRAAERT